MAALAAFDLDIAEHDDVLELAVAGDLDCASAPRLRQVMTEATRDYRVVIVDLSSTEFADCAGIGVVAAAHEEQRARGRDLVLRSPSSAVRRLMELTGLSQEIATTGPATRSGQAP